MIQCPKNVNFSTINVFNITNTLWCLNLKVNVPVSVSAHLLSSMRNKKIPLRAELLDIANCILDGADALVLSAETAVGEYPVETVACLANCCKEAEACVWSKQIFYDLIDKVCLKLFSTFIKLPLKLK